MFHGSIPDDMRRIVAQHVKHWDCDEIFVGCSGNFTVERVIQPLGDWNIHSNDITLYSSALGFFFSGLPLDLELRPEYDEEVGWLREFMGTPVEALATVLISTRLAPAIGRRNHAYYSRLLDAFQAQWPALHENTVKRLLSSPLKLESYYAGDVYDMAAEAPKSEGFITYPPFFGESQDYEKGFALIADMFGWELPEYQLMTGERMKEFFANLRSFRYWLFGTKERLPEMEPHLRGITQTTNRGVSIYVYSNCGPTRIVQPSQTIEPFLAPRLQQGQDIGDRLWLTPLSEGQFAALRSMYMNENIKPGQASLCLGVMCDDALVGVFAFSTAPSLSNWATHIEEPTVYLLSDFPVAPSDYPRLSKLVLYAALSKEAKLLAERAARKRILSVVTTAFTKRPVSMKYRGMFRLLNRTENKVDTSDKNLSPADLYYANSFKINYGSEAGRWTLAEGLAEWKKKHGSKA